MLALDNKSLLEVCAGIRTSHADRLISLRHRPAATKSRPGESRVAEGSVAVLVEIEGEGQPSGAPVCVWSADDVSASNDGVHVARVRLLAPDGAEHGAPEAIGAGGSTSTKPVPMEEDLNDEDEDDEEYIDGGVLPPTDMSKRKLPTDLSSAPQSKRHVIHERTVVEAANNAENRAEAKNSRAQMNASIRSADDLETRRNARTKKIQDSLRAGQARGGGPLDVGSKVATRASAKRASIPQGLSYQNDDTLVLMVKLPNGEWEPTTEKDTLENEQHHGLEKAKMRWGDLTAQQRGRVDLSEALAAAPKPKSIRAVRGSLKDAAPKSLKSRAVAPQSKISDEGGAFEYGSPRKALDLLILAVRDYKRQFGSAPSASILKLTGLPRNFKSKLREEGVNFPGPSDPTPEPRRDAKKDADRDEQFKQEDVEAYYAHQRILASIVDAKLQLEKRDDDEGTPGRSAAAIDWLKEQIENHRNSLYNQYSSIRKRIEDSGNMRRVSNTDEWKALIKADYASNNAPSEEQSDDVLEYRSKIMVRYDKEAVKADPTKDALNSIYDKWATSRRSGVLSEASKHVLEWLSLQRKVGKLRDYHQSRAIEVEEERKLKREQRKAYVSQREAFKRIYKENEDKFYQMLETLPEWCRNESMFKEKELELERASEEFEKPLNAMEMEMKRRAYLTLKGQLEECKTKRESVIALATLVAESKVNYEKTQRVVLTIDNVLRLLTNRIAFHKNHERKRSPENEDVRNARNAKYKARERSLRLFAQSKANDPALVAAYKIQVTWDEKFETLQKTLKYLVDGKREFDELKASGEAIKKKLVDKVEDSMKNPNIVNAIRALEKAKKHEDELRSRAASMGSKSIEEELELAKRGLAELSKKEIGSEDREKDAECKSLGEQLASAEAAFKKYGEDMLPKIKNLETVKASVDRYVMLTNELKPILTRIAELKELKGQKALSKDGKSELGSSRERRDTLILEVNEQGEAIEGMDFGVLERANFGDLDDQKIGEWKGKWEDEYNRISTEVNSERRLLKDKVTELRGALRDCKEVLARGMMGQINEARLSVEDWTKRLQKARESGDYNADDESMKALSSDLSAAIESTQNATRKRAELLAVHEQLYREIKIPNKNTDGKTTRTENNKSNLKKIINNPTYSWYVEENDRREFGRYVEETSRRDGKIKTAKDYAVPLIKQARVSKDTERQNQVKAALLVAQNKGCLNAKTVAELIKQGEDDATVSADLPNIPKNKRATGADIAPDAPDDLTSKIYANMSREIAEIVKYSLMGSPRARQYHRLLCLQFQRVFATQEISSRPSGLQDNSELQCNVALPRVGEDESMVTASDEVFVDWAVMSENYAESFKDIRTLLFKYGVRNRTSERVGVVPEPAEAIAMVNQTRDARGENPVLDKDTGDVTIYADKNAASRVPVVWAEFVSDEGTPSQRKWVVPVNDRGEPLRQSPDDMFYAHQSSSEFFNAWARVASQKETDLRPFELDGVAREYIKRAQVVPLAIPEAVRNQIPYRLPPSEAVAEALSEERRRVADLKSEASRIREALLRKKAERQSFLGARQTKTQLGAGVLMLEDIIDTSTVSDDVARSFVNISNSTVPAADAALVRADDAVVQLEDRLSKLETEAMRMGYDLDATPVHLNATASARISVPADRPSTSASSLDGYLDRSWVDNEDLFKRARARIEAFLKTYYSWLNAHAWTAERFRATILPWLFNAKRDGYRVPTLSPPDFADVEPVGGIGIVRLALDPFQGGPPEGYESHSRRSYGKISGPSRQQSRTQLRGRPATGAVKYIGDQEEESAEDPSSKAASKMVEQERNRSAEEQYPESDLQTKSVDLFKASQGASAGSPATQETLSIILSVQPNPVSNIERDRMLVSSYSTLLLHKAMGSGASFVEQHEEWTRQYNLENNQVVFASEDQYIDIDFEDDEFPPKYSGSLERLNASGPRMIRRVRDALMRKNPDAARWGMAYHVSDGKRRWCLVEMNAPPANLRRDPVELVYENEQEAQTDEDFAKWERSVKMRRAMVPAFGLLESDDDLTDDGLDDDIDEPFFEGDSDEDDYDEDDEGEDGEEDGDTPIGARLARERAAFDPGSIRAPRDDEGAALRPLALPALPA